MEALLENVVNQQLRNQDVEKKGLEKGSEDGLE